MSTAHGRNEPRDPLEPEDGPGHAADDAAPRARAEQDGPSAEQPRPVNCSSEANSDSDSDTDTDAGATDADAAAGRTPEVDLDGMDEVALRRLLRESVRDIEPSPGSLEHLRHAVPARRARRRNVMVGAAAAVVACGVAVPTMLHTDFVPGVFGKPMANAGHSHDHVPQEQRSGGGDQGQGASGRDTTAGGAPGEHHRGGQAGAPTTGTSTGPNPSSSLGPVSPTCTRAQLGAAGSEQQAPDAQGHVYGAFRVVNVSTDSCTVEGGGIVLATAQGSADSSMIQVVDHTSGDAATGLPDPVTATDEVVLEPGAAYVVRFAWVPTAGGGCPTSPLPGGSGGGGGDGTQAGGQRPMGDSGDVIDAGTSGGTGGSGGEGGDGTPDGPGSGTEGSGSGGSGTGGSDTGGTDGGSTGGGGGDPVPPASVLLSHTPEAGEPSVQPVQLDGACAGTVYRTGVLPAG